MERTVIWSGQKQSGRSLEVEVLYRLVRRLSPDSLSSTSMIGQGKKRYNGVKRTERKGKSSKAILPTSVWQVHLSLFSTMPPRPSTFHLPPPIRTKPLQTSKRKEKKSTVWILLGFILLGLFFSALHEFPIGLSHNASAIRYGN